MALALAACGDGVEPAAAPAVSAERVVTATPEPTEPPAVAAPVLPEAAKEPTPEGASAFVRYYFETVNYAYATGDTDALVTLSADDCIACQAVVAEVRDGYRDSSHIVGGHISVVDAAVPVVPEDGPTEALVLVEQASGQSLNQDGSARFEIPAVEDYPVRMLLLRPQADAWQVSAWGNDAPPTS